jgi:hypothetical protein
MKVKEARELVEQFEARTLPKDQWTHTAHFVMAFWYCYHFPLPQAIQKIRNGITTYNVSVGGSNTESTGYHETITLFYTFTITNYLLTSGIIVLSDEQLTLFLQQPFLGKNYLLQFYNKTVLESKDARMGWVPPDKRHSF